MVKTCMTPSETSINNIEKQIKQLQQIHDASIRISQSIEVKELAERIIYTVDDLLNYGRTMLLILDDDDVSLKLSHVSAPPTNPDNQKRLKNAYLNTFNMNEDPIIGTWLTNRPVLLIGSETQPNSPVIEFMTLAEFECFYSVPLLHNKRLIGVITVELLTNQEISEDDKALLKQLAESCEVILQNARLHTRTVKKLESNMHEMTIIQQIDRELNERIELTSVFTMTLDWALRFTNANAATIALYDEMTDTLRTMVNYGYEISDEELAALREQSEDTISRRVAQTGQIEVVPDVMMETGYNWRATGVRSQISAPVMREDQVIAVITLESKRVNAFIDTHVSFVEKLANRAGVAIDNARLYSETEVERSKLSNILANIANIVIVVGRDGRLMLINQAAISVLGLYTEQHYVGRPFTEVIDFEPLKRLFYRTSSSQESEDDELTLPNNRVYFTKVIPQDSIGYIIVMQDITPYKEMDKLKSELIATVSHDLKQPLGVMRGYLDLLQMTTTFEGKAMDFVGMIDRSITNMRSLIDDLLDLARIESGVDLQFEPVTLKSLLIECIEANEGHAESKSMTIITDLEGETPVVNGERSRLRQVFNNLISNAIKYTPPEGEVRVSTEIRGEEVRVAIADNGLGISAEDQAHIFDRFYRVRRAETESIDGTGLGLAIVKKLVEAHRGKIRVESQLGEGSTFYVTFPLSKETPLYP